MEDERVVVGHQLGSFHLFHSLHDLIRGSNLFFKRSWIYNAILTRASHSSHFPRSNVVLNDGNVFQSHLNLFFWWIFTWWAINFIRLSIWTFEEFGAVSWMWKMNGWLWVTSWAAATFYTVCATWLGVRIYFSQARRIIEAILTRDCHSSHFRRSNVALNEKKNVPSSKSNVNHNSTFRTFKRHRQSIGAFEEPLTIRWIV